MSIINKLSNKKTLTAIIILKIVLVALLIGVMTDGLYFGDRASHAATDPAAQVQADGSKDGKVAAESAPGKGDPKAAADSKKRRSFLDDLLNLPAIDREEPKKDEIGRYLALAERKARQVEDRMALLKQRETQLMKLEQSIDEKLLKLDEERAFLAQTLQREKDLKGKRIEHLIDLYKKMDPKKAAPLLEKLDKDLVVALFNSLPNKQMTSILEAMSPAKSVELTEYFGRVRSGKEYELLREMNASLRQEFQECKGLPGDKPAAKTAAAEASEQKGEADVAH